MFGLLEVGDDLWVLGGFSSGDDDYGDGGGFDVLEDLGVGVLGHVLALGCGVGEAVGALHVALVGDSCEHLFSFWCQRRVWFWGVSCRCRWLRVVCCSVVFFLARLCFIWGCVVVEVVVG